MKWVYFHNGVIIIPPLSEGGGGYTVLPVLPSVQDIFRRIFLSNCWWQKSDIWSQASYRYPISWEAFLDPSDSYFLFADFVDFYTHLTYICISIPLLPEETIILINGSWQYRVIFLDLPNLQLESFLISVFLSTA
jgi:hypothetical protein